MIHANLFQSWPWLMTVRTGVVYQLRVQAKISWDLFPALVLACLKSNPGINSFFFKVCTMLLCVLAFRSYDCDLELSLLMILQFRETDTEF